jgi:dTDP-4-amino-4,6-dideoxygalactose transaminase
MISYDGWDREYQENKQAYLDVFDRFMNQTNYENAERFEKSFAEMIGRKYAVSVATATDALYFSLLSYGIGQGDEVLVTDFSWISTSSCISMTGATPVFCDINLDSYHMNLDSIKKMYSEKTRAIIYTHLFGNMSDIDNILNFCKEKNIVFIEDSAQSLGSSFRGINAGTIGDCSSFSFNTNKVVAGINGGGIFLTDNKDQADLVRKIRRHGKNKDFEMLGYNSRLYVLNSEIINIRLQNREKHQNKRQQIASLYTYSFKDLPVHTQSCSHELTHNYHKYVIRFETKETRDRIKNELNASIHYDTALSMNSMYSKINHRRDDCKNSNLSANTILSLPVHAWLTDHEINTVINCVVANLK